eukprot:7319878-Ditylum_brightwellii.AAC.1
MLFSEHLNPHETLSSPPMKTSNSCSHHSGHNSHRGAAPQPSLVRRLTLCVRIVLRTPYWSDWYGLLIAHILQSEWIALRTHPVRFDSNPYGLMSGCPVITYLVMSDGY